MDPGLWGYIIAGSATAFGSFLVYRATRVTAKGTEAVEGVKVVIDGFDRLHTSDVGEIDRLKAALVEERAVSAALAATADRMKAERDEARAQLAEREGP